MAHIAGLVAGGRASQPGAARRFVTTTTHKTLRGPRGGHDPVQGRSTPPTIDKTVFPGIQGGPLMHVIAAKAVCFGEALQPEFKDYQHQIVENAKALAASVDGRGVPHRLRRHRQPPDAGGRLLPRACCGSEAEKALDEAGITVNKNAIPFDTNPPMKPSGIRIGTPAVTTRGMKEPEMRQIGRLDCRGLTPSRRT